MNNTDCKNATFDIKDDKITGLTLRVFKNRKSFYLRYRFEGRQRQPKLGDYPAINVAQARTIAQDMLHQVAQGTDPSAERQEARKAVSMSELCNMYMELHGDEKGTSKEDRRMIDTYVIPKLGKKRAIDVDVLDVLNLHRGMKETPYQANRVRSLLSKMFNLAEGWKVRKKGTNPCDHVPAFKEKKRRRYATADELGQVFERLVHYTEEYPQAAAFIWLQIYTGARPKELRTARPEHIQGNKIVLEEHKTEHSTDDNRVIFLPPQAVELIATLPRTRSGTLLGILSPKHLWEKIKTDTGIQNLRMYDLRHTFASIGLSHNMPLDKLRELMGHKSAVTTTRYAHLIDERAAEAAADVASAIDGFAKPQAPATAKPSLKLVKS